MFVNECARFQNFYFMFFIFHIQGQLLLVWGSDILYEAATCTNVVEYRLTYQHTICRQYPYSANVQSGGKLSNLSRIQMLKI